MARGNTIASNRRDDRGCTATFSPPLSYLPVALPPCFLSFRVQSLSSLFLRLGRKAEAHLLSLISLIEGGAKEIAMYYSPVVGVDSGGITCCF